MLELTGFGVHHHQPLRLGLTAGVRGDGDASQDDVEDEDTNTSEEGLPLTGRPSSVSLRGTKRSLAQKKASLPASRLFPSVLLQIVRRLRGINSRGVRGVAKRHKKIKFPVCDSVSDSDLNQCSQCTCVVDEECGLSDEAGGWFLSG